jgi:hypothetical protein
LMSSTDFLSSSSLHLVLDTLTEGWKTLISSLTTLDYPLFGRVDSWLRVGCLRGLACSPVPFQFLQSGLELFITHGWVSFSCGDDFTNFFLLLATGYVLGSHFKKSSLELLPGHRVILCLLHLLLFHLHHIVSLCRLLEQSLFLLGPCLDFSL